MVSLASNRPPSKKPKIPAELLEMATPRSIFKSFSFCVRSRGMGVLPKTSYHLKNYYICSMNIIIENRLPYGLNVGFEYYRPDDIMDCYELHINLLIIKIALVWHE